MRHGVSPVSAVLHASPIVMVQAKWKNLEQWMQLSPKHRHSLAVLHSLGSMAPEKRVLLAHTKESSGIVAACQEKQFTVRYSIPVTGKVLRSGWADATCKFLSVSLWDKEHPYCNARPWQGGERKEWTRVAAHTVGQFVFLLLPLCFGMLYPSLLP